MKRIVIGLVVGLAGTAQATTPTADWPCIQPRQPHLSLGQVWSGPAPDDATTARAAAPEIAGLAERLSQRRLPVADAEAEIAKWAADRPDADLTALMQALVGHVDGYRTQILDGIARYGHKQVALAAQVETRRGRMAKLQATTPQDFDAIDAEEKALDIDSRVFTERQQSLTYICETPVLLEQRLFALGRAIASQLGE